MLTFLRKIRKGLVGSGRDGKYLMYAIGEIALVVIGILIALQINNWNEDKKAEQLEIVTLTELRNNVVANIDEIDRMTKSNSKRISSIIGIEEAFSTKKPFDDSIASYFGWAMVYDRIYLNNGAYTSFLSAGSNVIRDESLRFQISNYFDQYLGDLEGFVEEGRDDFYSYMLDYLRTEFSFYSNNDHIGIPRDYNSLMNNETFIQSIGIFYDVQYDLNLRLILAKEESVELKTRIVARLSKLGYDKI